METPTWPAHGDNALLQVPWRSAASTEWQQFPQEVIIEK